MNKKQLIEALATATDDTIILVSSDAEGNSYSSLEYVGSMLIPQVYSGGETEDIFSEEDVILDYEDEESSEMFKPVVVLYP